jgi:hypothetical protein
MCKHCKIDPPNIVEETANGDLVRELYGAYPFEGIAERLPIGMCRLRVGVRGSGCRHQK